MRSKVLDRDAGEPIMECPNCGGVMIPMAVYDSPAPHSVWYCTECQATVEFDEEEL